MIGCIQDLDDIESEIFILNVYAIQNFLFAVEALLSECFCVDGDYIEQGGKDYSRTLSRSYCNLRWMG